jgi:restriction system protein
VIATKKGFGSIRFLEQIKAYSPNYLVTHDDVRAMLGVLSTDANASKGLITTTSDFQPTIRSSPEFLRFIPHRLELKNGEELQLWLDKIARPVE